MPCQQSVCWREGELVGKKGVGGEEGRKSFYGR